MRIVAAAADFEDWAGLLDLLRGAFAYMDGRIDPPSSLAAMGIDELRAKARKESLIVALDGDTIIGCVFAALRDDCVYVGKLAVAHRARGRGVARRLVAAAESMARDHARPWVELQTRIELVENHRTFAALGFERVAETAHPGYTRPTSITMRRKVSTAG